jgi:dihydrofolate synthase/folylpolyglutamate synthase
MSPPSANGAVPAIGAALDYLRTFTDYEQTLPSDASRTFDLERTKKLLAALGDPHRGRPCIHVTGTKGKGSVVLLADAIIRAHGVRTFRYMSPHVERINERIALGGADVSDERLAEAIFALRPVIEAAKSSVPSDPPTFFEVMTATGFFLAREGGAEADVVEVGLGGRLDATNVVDPTLAVITSIGLDHTRILGRTRDKIAAEKAGIIKPGKPVLLGLGRGDPGFEVILARARALDAPATYPGHGVLVGGRRFAKTRDGRPGVAFSGAVFDHEIREAVVPGGALHQAVNALLAVGSAGKALGALGRKLDLAVAIEALETAVLPARAELFAGRVLLDGAHTGESCAALVALARWLFADRRIVLLAGLTRDRSVRSLFSPFLDVVERAVFAPLPSPRSTDPAAAAAEWSALGGTADSAGDGAQALERALAAAGQDGAVVVAGSFYLAGSLRPALRALDARPGGGARL